MSSELAILNVERKFKSSDCVEFEFKVDKFSTVRSVTTSKLVTSQACGATFRILLETAPRIDNSDSNYRTILHEGKMRVGLQRAYSLQYKIEVFFFFEVLNTEGEVYIKDSIEKVFCQTETELFCDFMRRPRKTAKAGKLRDIKFSLPDDVLIIRGSVFIRDCFAKPEAEKDLEFLAIHANNVNELQANFGEMCRNPTFSDVALCFGESKIYAYKGVLSSWSVVFRRMFEHEFIESKSNLVKILDIEKCVFEDLLKFFYNGLVKRKDLNSILSLYEAADKYEVMSLFKTCSSFLETYISDETAPLISKYAFMHSDQFLQEKASVYIIENLSNVEKTSGWNTLRNRDPFLASLILLLKILDILYQVKPIDILMQYYTKDNFQVKFKNLNCLDEFYLLEVFEI